MDFCNLVLVSSDMEELNKEELIAEASNCVKSVQIRSFFGSVFSRIWTVGRVCKKQRSFEENWINFQKISVVTLNLS